MDIDEYNTEKKMVPIIGIILMIVGIIGYIIFHILDWFLKVLPTGLSWAVLIVVIVIFIAGSLCIENAKKKKYGSLKLIRVGEVLSWGLCAVIIICILLRFFIH